MKKFLLLMILAHPFVVLAQDISPAETCIAENGGAASVECLQKIYDNLNRELDQLNQKILSSLDDRLQKETITHTHYEYASTAFKKSNSDFKLYRESSCNALTYYTGAVASGYGQNLYKCLISKTEIQNQFLKRMLEF
jgi:uncharacterized protein YecT (DUF1311 family)